MDIFYIVVPTIALTILIILLTYIGIQMNNKKKSSISYPPIYGNCPDYWTIDENSNCKIPGYPGINVGNNKFTDTPTYDSTKNTIKFFGTDSGASWQTSKTGALSAQCIIQNWANNHGIVWDGITNYNGCSA